MPQNVLIRGFFRRGLVDETRGQRELGRNGRHGHPRRTDLVNLGDRDLALHLWRTHLLKEGHCIIASRLGAFHAIVPTSNSPIRTLLQTNDGELPFQNYFVRQRCQPVVTGIRYDDDASLNPEVAAAFTDPHLRGIIIRRPICE